ncbi:MAG TPA: proton-conducting transporter membrane subunit [Anaeromyxobacteraceae bacterium]|nr:proton-conducting transporter membrane subunit [Anaeromyxobacteraceae bacterium]
MRLLLGAIGILLAGAIAALAAGRRRRLALAISSGAACLGGATGLAGVVPVLLGAPAAELSLAWGVPAGAFHLRLDPLAAFFLTPLFALAVPASIYGAGYMGRVASRRSLAAFAAFFDLLVASIALVFAAADGVLFLVAWEVMTVATFALVTFEDEHADVRSAGYTFLVASHLGTAFLFALFVLLASGAGGFDFGRFEALRDGVRAPALLFALGLVGFGTKAGLVPLHVWLPEAHPAAPSHVSALLSAVMIKTGVYGVLRLLGFVPAAPVGFGLVLAAVGLASALVAITLALGQADVKRALAYSSVENVGIVFLGLGLGVIGSAAGEPRVAALGFGGALFHVWTHALMKSLAFMGGGALAHEVHTRDVERMGGLLARLPLTGTAFLVGAAALSAMPPLAGFASEWLLYLGLFDGATASQGVGSLVALLGASVLALVGALAAIAFTRLAGMSLLGAPRTGAAAAAREPSALLFGPLLALAAACVLVGVLPGPVLRLVAPAAAQVAGAPTAALADVAASAAGPLRGMGLALLAAALAAAAVARRAVRSRNVRRAETWGCGFGEPTPRMEYTASSYAQFLLAGLVPRSLQPRTRFAPPHGLFPRTSSFRTEPQDPARTRLFDPLFRGLADRMSRLRRFQAGRLNLQLLYTLATLLALLAAMVIAGRMR